MVNLYLIFPIKDGDSFLESNGFLPENEDSLANFIKDIRKLLQNKEFSFFIDSENISSFLESYSTFGEEHIKSIPAKIQNELRGKCSPISFDILKNQNNLHFVWKTDNSHAQQISPNHIFIKITENLLQNTEKQPLILNLDALNKGKLGLRDNHLFIFKDNGKVEKPLFVVIPCVENIGEIQKWIYKNITLKECLSPEAYKRVCEELENPNSELSKILQEFDFETWIPSEKYFPLIEFALYFFPNQDAKSFIESQRSQRQDKEKIKNTNEKWAKLNGYVFDNCVTSENSQATRYIYKAGKGIQRIYISIDFKNSEWEVCNSEGKWQEAYGYEGNCLNKLDSVREDKEGYKRKHSITVPSKCK